VKRPRRCSVQIGVMLRKVTIVQCEVGRPLAKDENLLIFKQRPDFVILPEYFNVDPRRRDTAKNAAEAHNHLQYCRTLSDRFEAVLIAGTAITIEDNLFYNTCHVYNRGRLQGVFHKLNPTEKEQKHGITPGREMSLFECDGVRYSTLICADVLRHDNFVRLNEFEPDIVFVPITSPLRPHESIREKFARDEKIFVEGAQASGSYVVKCCAIGRLWGGDLQGRSLVAAPWGVLTRVAPDEENRPRILSVILDIEGLREFRRKRQRLN